MPWALAIISAGVTTAQIALMQLLSYLQWHHFAYLVVSVALLGFGASGTVLTIWRSALLARATMLLPWLAIGAGAGFTAAVALLQTPVLRFDLYLLFVEGTQWLRLSATCLLLALPFFCAGLVTGLILTAGVERAGRLYFANLAGAGAGAVAGLALLGWFEPARLPAITALISFAAALVLFQRQRAGMVVTVTLALIAVSAAVLAPSLRLSPFKDLAQTLDLPGARVVHSEPSPQGWLQVVDAPALRAAPPADLTFAGRVPHQQAVFVDGNRYASILDADESDDALDIFSAGPESLPWLLGNPRRVLLLHEGAGGLAAYARRAGAVTVELIEPHRGLAQLLARRFASDSGITVRSGESRAALAGNSGDYDLIRLPTAGTFGGSAGLRAVGEEFLFTRDAVAAAWRRLADDGFLSVTAWMDHPERTPLRLLVTLVAGLEEVGVDNVAAHLIAVRGWASVVFVVRRSAFDDAAVAQIRDFCREHGFDPLLLPRLRPEERDFYHAWDNEAFFELTDAIMSGDGASPEVADQPYRLTAPTDNRPYFSQFMRPTAALELLHTHGWQSIPFFELGSVVVAITLAILVVLATVLIMLPLLRRGWRGTARAWTFGYFAALGAGFMLLEIVLMLRLIPFLGGPVSAAAVVVGSLLVSAGLGSRYSQRFAARRGTLLAVTILAGGGILVLGVVTNTLPFASESGLWWRVAASALLIAPVGCVLGMAFPTGLRLLARHSNAQVPWAWAVNSCLSVVTPAAATLGAVDFGYALIFELAALMYGLAALATWRLAPPRP